MNMIRHRHKAMHIQAVTLRRTRNLITYTQIRVLIGPYKELPFYDASCDLNGLSRLMTSRRRHISPPALEVSEFSPLNCYRPVAAIVALSPSFCGRLTLFR